MRKTVIFMVAMLMLAISNVTAQSNFDGKAKFTDNWSIGINGGVQTNLHDWNLPQGAVVGININKEFTPVYGITFEANAGFNNNANMFGNYPAAVKKVPMYSRHQAYSCGGTFIEDLSVFVDGRMNLTNAFLGYNGTPRNFELGALLGMGYERVFNNTYYSKRNYVLVKTGLNFDFNLGKSKAWTFNVQPAVIWNISKPKQFNSNFGVFQLTAGFVYHFKTSNGTHHFTSAKFWDAAQIARLNRKIKELEERKPQVIEKVKYVNAQEKYVVTFFFDSDEISDAGKAELDKIGNNALVVVDGYASVEPTSNENYQVELSQRRADAVKAYLENRGVRVDSAVGHGSNDEYGRVVVVTFKK